MTMPGKMIKHAHKPTQTAVSATWTHLCVTCARGGAPARSTLCTVCTCGKLRYTARTVAYMMWKMAQYRAVARQMLWITLWIVWRVLQAVHNVAARAPCRGAAACPTCAGCGMRRRRSRRIDICIIMQRTCSNYTIAVSRARVYNKTMNDSARRRAARLKGV